MLNLGFIHNWEKSELVPFRFQFPSCSIPVSISPYRPLSGQHYPPPPPLQLAIAKLLGGRQALPPQLYSIIGQMVHGVYGQSPAIGESFHETSSVRIEGEMVSKSGFVGQHYSSRAVVQQAVVCTMSRK